MTIDPTLLSAIIAAAVSILVALISYAAALRAIKAERRLNERELERKISEKVIDVRLREYPRAFSITSSLSGGRLLVKGISKQELQSILEQLLDWNSSTAGLVMSEDSVQAYYALRSRLRKMVFQSEDGNFQESQLKSLWRASVALRKKLREDLLLVRIEERKDKNHSTEFDE